MFIHDNASPMSTVPLQNITVQIDHKLEQELIFYCSYNHREVKYEILYLS